MTDHTEESRMSDRLTEVVGEDLIVIYGAPHETERYIR